MRHVASPGIGLRRRIEKRVDASRGRPASFEEVGIGSQAGGLSQVRWTFAGFS